MEKKKVKIRTRSKAPITQFDKDFIKLVNKTLVKKGMTVNDLTRACNSYNYDNFRDYFNDHKGEFRSRTIGKVCKVLNLTIVEK